MIRWLIFLGALALWLATMALVYHEYGPRPPSKEALNNRSVLEAVFDESEPTSEAWRIFVNIKQLAGSTGGAPSLLNPPLREKEEQRQAKAQLAAFQMGAGVGEEQIGTLATRTIRRGYTRAEVITTMRWELPRRFHSTLMQIAGSASYESHAHATIDEGLVDFSFKLKVGLGLEAIGKGFRERNRLKLNLALFQDGASRNLSGGTGGKENPMYRTEFEVSGASMPKLGFSPFLRRPSIREGQHWEVALLDVAGGSSKPQLRSVRAEVVGREKMRYHEREVYVFKVLAQSGKRAYRAYYSLDGRVLKQQWKFMDLLPVTLIREEEGAAPQ